MRDVIILHAVEDAARAASLAAGNPRVWLIDAVSPAAPLGAFGPRFQLVALWSSGAEKAGLGPVMANLLAGREQAVYVLSIDGATPPAALRQNAAFVGRADRHGLAAALASTQAAADVARPRTFRAAARALPRALAAAALSIGFGAVLAHATAVDRAQALDTEFGLAPVEKAAAAPAAAPTPAPAVDPIEVRAEGLLARARAEDASAAARARARAVASFRAAND